MLNAELHGKMVGEHSAEKIIDAFERLWEEYE